MASVTGQIPTSPSPRVIITGGTSRPVELGTKEKPGSKCENFPLPAILEELTSPPTAANFTPGLPTIAMAHSRSSTIRKTSSSIRLEVATRKILDHQTSRMKVNL